MMTALLSNTEHPLGCDTRSLHSQPPISSYPWGALLSPSFSYEHLDPLSLGVFARGPFWQGLCEQEHKPHSQAALGGNLAPLHPAVWPWASLLASLNLILSSAEEDARACPVGLQWR
jgi:hypothetical protein